MIRNIHVEQLREHVQQAERDLAGWRFLLGQAEQGERAGTVMPDPLMPAGQAWPAQPAPWQHSEPLPRGVDPYPTSVMPSIDGSLLPPKQEDAFGAFTAEHHELAQSPKAVQEDEKWRQA